MRSSSQQKRIKLRASASGLHVYWRDNGLNVLIDEIDVPQQLWAQAPRHVSVALTNACDLHCSFCYAPKIPAKLDFDQVLLWLGELDSQGTIGVGFGGGEPTLYPRFAELCSQVSLNTGLAVSMTTHGHHLSDALLDELESSVHFIRVSIDGVGKRYEQIRGRPFSTLLERLRAISGRFSFGLNFVVNSSTVKDLDAVAILAQDIGAQQLLLLPERPVNGRNGANSTAIEALRTWVARYIGAMPLAISESDAEGFPTCDPLAKEHGLGAYAHIDASGQLKRSSFDGVGVPIASDAVMNALAKLRTTPQVLHP